MKRWSTENIVLAINGLKDITGATGYATARRDDVVIEQQCPIHAGAKDEPPYIEMHITPEQSAKLGPGRVLFEATVVKGESIFKSNTMSLVCEEAVSRGRR